jgi:hypothetical protein
MQGGGQLGEFNTGQINKHRCSLLLFHRDDRAILSACRLFAQDGWLL